jgi:hypothetical protein
MEKLTEWVLALSAAIASGIAWAIRRLFGKMDTLETRLDLVERDQLTKEDLKTTLKPLQETTNLVLNHLLDHRNTEK